jgi:dihydroxyacetone kinase phosphoprotein-dependent L subunit
MTEECLNSRNWIQIFEEVADRIEAAKDRLNELDGVIGDGDHGVTMTIGFRAVKQSLQALPADVAIDEIFSKAGEVFMDAAGGAIGPLMGTMWTDSAKALAGCRSFGTPECKQMLEAMENAIVRRGRAKPGDKTILDALHPAVEAGIAAQRQGLRAMFRNAADAAKAGANSTSGMISRLGRSSRLGQRTLGHEDAGANSIAVILDSMAEAVATRR